MRSIPRLNLVLALLATLLVGFSMAMLLRPGPVGAQYPTPLGIDVMSPNKPAGTIQGFKGEYVTVAASATQNLVNYTSGDGYVSDLLIAISSTNANARDASLLNITYNNEGSPSVSMRVDRFFGGVYVDTNAGTQMLWNNAFFSVNWDNTQNVGYVVRLPIPFHNAIKIDLVNGSGSNSLVLFWTGILHTGVPDAWPNTRRLQAASFYTGSGGCAPNAVQTLLDASAVGVPGRLAGVWWLDDNFPNNTTPRGAPMEGNFKIYLDGSATAAYESSGTEDYFMLPDYGAGAIEYGHQITGDFSGSGVNNLYNGTFFWGRGSTASVDAHNTASFYRFHVNDPIVFSTGLKITWACGDTTESSFTGNPVVWATVWYYTQN